MADKILVIEDHSDVRENIVEILELSGYETVDAPDGKQGVALAIEEKPDLILCDIMMPVMDGYSVLYMLSRNPATANVPFIFLTAKADKSDVRKGMNEGADDYITKPFSEMELLQAIEVRLNRSQKLKQVEPGSREELQELTDQATGTESSDELFEDARTESFGKKHSIYRSGSHAHFVYLIETGRVKLVKSHPDGKELITEMPGPGEYFGYEAVINDAPYNHEAIATEPTTCLLIPRERFQSLLSTRHDLMAHLVKTLSRKVTTEEEALLSLAYNSVRKRVVDALLRLSTNHDGAAQGVPFPAPREDIARLAGTASESVIRVLAELRDDKLIAIEGRKVVIHNPEKLAQLPY